MAPCDAPPPDKRTPDQAASGRPLGVGHPTYGDVADVLLDHGYEPLPIACKSKKPLPRRWTSVPIDARQVHRWQRAHPPACGIGIRTGHVVGVDIDILDPDLAHQAMALAQARLGTTPLMRVGLWPKRLLVYRTAQQFPKMSIRSAVEILAEGQQFVAFGIHPGTGRPYDWPFGETPLDVPPDALPEVDAEACGGLLAEISELLPAVQLHVGQGRKRWGQKTTGTGISRDGDGRVIDGRDAFLSTIAFHAVHDAIHSGQAADHDAIVNLVWRTFSEGADLERPRQDQDRTYRREDADAKVRDKLRLHAEGRLPDRAQPDVRTDVQPCHVTAADARQALDEAFPAAAERIEAWHRGEGASPPRIGIKATVGLGKTVGARRQLLALRERLVAAGLPGRLVLLVPSHRLAEELAAAWRGNGLSVAILRGYHAKDPVTGAKMCNDTQAVDAAIRARLSVHETCCIGVGGRRCPHVEHCPKQINRNEVATADVVVATHELLFTGFAIAPDTIAAILIDEAIWPRATTETGGMIVESLDREPVFLRGRHGLRERDSELMADLSDFRLRAKRALTHSGPGPLRRSSLVAEGLTADECSLAAELETRRLSDPGLTPGLPASARERAFETVALNERLHRLADLWTALGALLRGSQERDGRVTIGAPAADTGLHAITLAGVKLIHRNLAGKPILHLDATLRPEIAASVLPGLEVTEIEADQPQMSVRLVTGSFGKSSICPAPTADDAERRRRQNRLTDCVDYVRWHVQRGAPGRALVVTYKAIEPAFARIAGVETGHFNAIAGLDRYRDVQRLFVIGRPLPGEDALRRLGGALLGHTPASNGGYEHERRGVLLRNGAVRGVRVIGHSDERLEILRRAVCDDELIQAIGRGRGVNRTDTNPLEVHILADVALPLSHDRVLAWEIEVPDIVQRMLLAGIAVDSPADAVLLHPDLLGNEKQAQKAFERTGFKRQNPMNISYREMSLKSAEYRRPGRGRSWQTAYWIAGLPDANIRVRLETALGPLESWMPGQT